MWLTQFQAIFWEYNLSHNIETDVKTKLKTSTMAHHSLYCSFTMKWGYIFAEMEPQDVLGKVEPVQVQNFCEFQTSDQLP